MYRILVGSLCFLILGSEARDEPQHDAAALLRRPISKASEGNSLKPSDQV
jgi:hypothetical protein